MDHPKYEIHTDPAVMDDHLHLSRVVAGLDLPSMAPRPEALGSIDGSKLRAYCLASDAQYLIYLHHFVDHARPCVDEQIELRLPPGSFAVQHLDPKSGRTVERVRVRATGGATAVPLPEFTIDHCLLVERDED
jgi:hypothetical protein